MTHLAIKPGAVAEPAVQVVEQIGQFYQWALRRPDDPVAGGVIAAVRWLTGRRGTGPMTDRPTPNCLVSVQAEYAYAMGASRRPGSTSRRATGAALVLAVASGDLGMVPTLLAAIGPGAPLESSITYHCATGPR
jgi:hypothetical protein